MKQRIRVVGLIKNEDGVLILKRNRSRAEASVFWELPTGKIKFGEQPEEAMARSLSEFTGLTATSLKLKDVITFIALEGSSQLSNLYIVYEITLPTAARPIPRDRYSAYKYFKDSSNGIRLNEASVAVLEIEEGRSIPSRIASRSAANGVTVSVDGASRGNPGPAGIGYCILDHDGQVIEHGGEFIGFATSRIAEYYALKKGVERALALGFKDVKFFSDSLMVINQLNGIFPLKNQDTIPIYKDIESMLGRFHAVSFTHISRSENSIADKEANIAIDKIIGK